MAHHYPSLYSMRVEMAADVAMGGRPVSPLSLLRLWSKREGVELAATEREAKRRTNFCCGRLGLPFVARKGVVAEALTDPFAADRDLSANAAPGECVAFPALALDGGFELGFGTHFLPPSQQRVEGGGRCCASELLVRARRVSESSGECAGDSVAVRRIELED